MEYNNEPRLTMFIGLSKFPSHHDAASLTEWWENGLLKAVLIPNRWQNTLQIWSNDIHKVVYALN